MPGQTGKKFCSSADILLIFFKKVKTLNFPNLKNLFDSFLHLGVVGSSIRLDASTVCQLKCPTCCTGKGLNKSSALKNGFLKFEDFKKLLDENSWVKNIELSNYGEIFLNPDLNKIIEYASKNKVRLTADNGVNLNHLTEENAKCLVKNKFHSLSVSIDGATNDIYQIFRKGGDIKKVIENIKLINKYKEEYNSIYPKLTWQFIIFGHNEHEINKAKELALSLGMEFKPKLNGAKGYSPVKDEEFVKRESGLDVSSREEYEKKHNKKYLLPCYQIWHSPQINWDGTLLGCCMNKNISFGNVFDSGLKGAIKSREYENFKKFLLGKSSSSENLPCKKCPIYN